MKTYQQKPIPLILRNNHNKYQVNPEALQFFNSLQGKVAIISVAGIYRTGKSFLLNKMILNSADGFAVGPTTNAKTKGIWVWGKPLISHNQNDEIINVVVLDSEGLGSTEEDINHDLKLFSVTLLMSSAFLYNTVGSIDQNAIDSLGLVLRLCQHLKSQSYNDFPDFYWILRDFSLALVDKDGESLTTKQYLENCISPQPGDSQIRNKIRYSIKESFQNRNCITFVRPLMDEGSLQKLDKMQLDQLRPQFVQEVIDFRKLIFQSLKTKTIKGKEVKGQMLSDLISLYVSQINGDKIPLIQTGWKYVCQKQCQDVLDDISKKLSQKLSSLGQKLPETKAQFMSIKQQIESELTKNFIQKTGNNDQRQESLTQLKQIMGKSFNKLEQEMASRNAQQTKNFIRKQFESVEKKLKQGQLGNIAELSRQFQLFYQYFRKKCPYKDHVQVGLEYLLKKFSDCALVLFKSLKTKKESQTTGLRQEVQKLTNQLIMKEQKFKSQKQKLSDSLTITQSSLSNLKQQNNQYLSSMQEYESVIKSLKAEAEQLKQMKQSEAELEKISLKKKVIRLQDDLREMDCSRGLQLSNLKNTLLLKENQIAHLNEETTTLTKKLSSMQTQLDRMNEEKTSTIQQLSQDLEKLTASSHSELKSYEDKIRSKSQEISRLQNCLQARMNQIQLLKSEKLTLNQDSSMQTERQMQKIMFKFQDQISQLKDLNKSTSEELKLTSSKLQQEVQQKKMDLKMLRMDIQRERAVLQQKIDFFKSEIQHKEEKISKLQKENQYYLDMFQEKDDEITALACELEGVKMTQEHSSSEISAKFNEYQEQIKQKQREVQVFQKTVEGLQQSLRQNLLEKQSWKQKHQKINQQLNEAIRCSKLKVQQLTRQLQEKTNQFERQLGAQKQDNQRNLEEQKRNIELSIIQLKNYYEMEKERLQKKILQDRKKYQYTEEETLQQIEEKIKRQHKSHLEETSAYKNEIESLEQQLARLQNQYQSKLTYQQEQADNQTKLILSKYELLEKKFNDSIQELNTLENQTNQDRVSFIKKIQMLHFEIGKKDKELMQINSKRESLQNTLLKKEAQIDNVKKIMNQEIQNSLKKIQETNAKYQKLNEQYLQFKIDCEKELALCRQRNEFLNSKLTEMNKQKQIGSSKNLQKIDKLKIQEMKQQIEKAKNENIVYESKLQAIKKQFFQSQSTYKKQVSALEKQLDHQKQRLNLEKTKNTDLQAKVVSKNQLFKKQLDSIKEKYQNERNEHYRMIEELKQKNSSLEDQKNSISWKLQKQVALLNDKIEYAQRQKDQAKKQLQESQRRMLILSTQLKKSNERSSQDQESKKSTMDRRITQQLETMKISMKSRNEEQDEQIKKLKEELRCMKEKNVQLNEKVIRFQKSKLNEKYLVEEKQNLLRQKQSLESIYRQQKSKELQEWRRKINQLQKSNKDLMNENNLYMFQLQKSQSKWLMQKNSLIEKIAGLEDQLEWVRNTSELQRNSSKSRLDTSKRSDISKYSTGFK